MKKLLLLGLLTTNLLLSCSDNGTTPEPTPPTPPTPPGNLETLLTLSPSIIHLDEVTTRGIVKSFEQNNEIGIFYNDTCINRKFIFDGAQWKGSNVALAATLKDVYCYFPYNKNVTRHDNIPLDIDTQTDYLYGNAVVGTSSANAEIQMKHIFSLVRLALKKNNYPGVGKVESVTWNGIYNTAKYNVITNEIIPVGEKGNYQAGGNYYVDDSEDPVVVESILLPVVTAEGISVTIRVDGEERIYEIPAIHKWEQGKAYTYTLTLKGGHNSPVELEECPIDVSYWSTFGKTDNIVLATSDKDWFDIEPGSNEYGAIVYRNEGRMFGFLGYWTGFDAETGDMPEKWEGDFRMVLMDLSGKIVEQYQPCEITAENGGMMKGTSRRCYVTAPVGTYELGVLFRKKGETTWQKANRKDNVTQKDMTFTVKEQTNLPALRMIQIEDEVNTGVVIHFRPYDSNFNITYILSNRGNVRLKGEIKAVWERTFDYTGNCYRPCDKKTNATNDNTWQDEIGKVTVDLQPTVRFWDGIIPCSFPIKREMPKMSNGISYCVPMVHLYWKAEGSSEWVLLRLDMDPILAAKVNTSQEEANLFLEALNYLNFEQSHWK